MEPSVKEKITRTASEVLEGKGLELYDIEFPSQMGGTLRLSIWKAGEPVDEMGRRRGVTLDECAEVSREIDARIEGHVSEDFPFVLEVSSPGIERVLSRRSHFESAKGETIKVVTKQPTVIGDEGKKVSSLKGRLVELVEDVATIRLEGRQESREISLPLAEIKKANVVFSF